MHTIKLNSRNNTFRISQSPETIKIQAGGRRGIPGVGVPAGGSTGQLLAKASNTDYDTEWVTGSGGGGAVDSVNGQTGVVILDTDDIAEGGINQYFTNERVDDRVSILIQNGTGISWVYNDALGTLTPTVSLSPFSTTNLAEGSNLYFTNERVDDRVADLLDEGSNIELTYDDVSGSLVIAAIPSGSDQQVQFNDGGLFAGDTTFLFDPDLDQLTVNRIKITGGVPGVGKVLTSDADGLASWQPGGVGAVVWGDIGGDLEDQTDLYNELQRIELMSIVYATALGGI